MTDREYAYILYKEGTPQNEIARIFHRSEKTISLWKKEGDWDDRQTAEELSSHIIQEDAEDLLRYQLRTLKRMKEQYEEEAAKGNPLKLIAKGDIDGVRDLYNVTKQKEMEWTTYVKVVRELSSYLKSADINLAQAVTGHFDDFLNLKRKAL